MNVYADKCALKYKKEGGGGMEERQTPCVWWQGFGIYAEGPL